MASKPYVHPSVASLRGFYARCQELMTDAELNALDQLEKIVNAAVALEKHSENENIDADDNGEHLGVLFDVLATKKRESAGKRKL